MKIPPIAKGYERKWVACKTCGHVAYYDYVPYSLSSQIMTMPCGHGLTERWENVVTSITEADALARIAVQQKAA